MVCFSLNTYHYSRWIAGDQAISEVSYPLMGVVKKEADIPF